MVSQPLEGSKSETLNLDTPFVQMSIKTKLKKTPESRKKHIRE